MPVPKFRTSASKRDMRRSHHALKAPALSSCPNCQETKRPHVACHACGHYAGRQALDARQFQSNQWDGSGTDTTTPGT